jgi:hypothetical protein
MISALICVQKSLNSGLFKELLVMNDLYRTILNGAGFDVKGF